MKVLFLCLGNICRSPMAEAVFRNMVSQKGLDKVIHIDSAGIGGWHAGERPHKGTQEILTRFRIPHESMRSRKITSSDIGDFDYIVAMDEENMDALRRLGAQPGAHVFRLLDLVEEARDKNVPDPYYTGNFDEVYELVHVGCERLLQKLIEEHGL